MGVALGCVGAYLLVQIALQVVIAVFEIVMLKELPASWLLAAAGLLPAGLLLLGQPARASSKLE